MTDFFGVGNAMLAAARAYSAGARRSCRTTRLVESLRDGDRVVCADRRQAESLMRMCKERNVVISTLILEPGSKPGKVFESGSSEGRTLFDHVWLEYHYAALIESERNLIEYVERESSGYGEAHRETTRKYRELRVQYGVHSDRQRYFVGPSHEHTDAILGDLTTRAK